MKQSKRIISVFLFIVISFVAAFAQRSGPVVERRINQLIAQMTLAEKLGQLQQLDGDASGFARPEHFEMARKGLL